jgi:alpha-tubulin suppressor-like RCC1 family protein
VAVDEKGRVFVCGSNNYRQLGLGNVRKTNTFQHVSVFDDHPVFLASLGDTFTAFLTESLELYTCGDGDEYRLCNSTIRRVQVPTPADAAIGRAVMWISCGCCHIIMAENLEEVPRHPGRLHFGLDETKLAL